MGAQVNGREMIARTREILARVVHFDTERKRKLTSILIQKENGTVLKME